MAIRYNIFKNNDREWFAHRIGDHIPARRGDDPLYCRSKCQALMNAAHLQGVPVHVYVEMRKQAGIVDGHK